MSKVVSYRCDWCDDPITVSFLSVEGKDVHTFCLWDMSVLDAFWFFGIEAVSVSGEERVLLDKNGLQRVRDEEYF